MDRGNVASRTPETSSREARLDELNAAGDDRGCPGSERVPIGRIVRQRETTGMSSAAASATADTRNVDRLAGNQETSSREARPEPANATTSYSRLARKRMRYRANRTVQQQGASGASSTGISSAASSATSATATLTSTPNDRGSLHGNPRNPRFHSDHCVCSRCISHQMDQLASSTTESRRAGMDDLFSILYQLSLDLDDLNDRLDAFLPATRNGLTQTQIELLPTRTFEEGDEGGDSSQSQCLVCLADYRRGERLRVLSCHVFHSQCVDEWLKNSATCPICRQPVRF